MPHGELQAELELLYRAAGRPPYRRVSAEIRRQNHMPDTVSHETVGSILRGDVRVRWSKLESVVRQLAIMAVHRPDQEEEVRRFHALWLAMVDSQRPDHPPTPKPVDEFAPPDIGTLSAPALPDGLPPGITPQRNHAFTGRRDLLHQISGRLAEEPWQPLILHGLAGVGKSQLAVEYLHRNAQRYDIVWWITAEDPSRATAALATLGERREWPASYDMAQTARTVLARLESGAGRWLIVYDNANSPDEIVPLLPQAGGHLIVTTRDAAWLSQGRALEVDVFTRPESIDLLCARGHQIMREEADQLAARLGDLPLALEQVAAMQSATRTPVADYLQQLDEREAALRLLMSTAPGDYRIPVATAVTVAAERIRKESTSTAQLLELISCLGAEPISLTLLRSGSQPIPPPLGRLLELPDALEQAVWRLRRYGLVKVVDDGQALQVHRLVQAIVRDALPADARAQAYTNARRLLAAANPGNPTAPLTWDMYGRIGPHLRPAGMVDATDPDARQTLIDQATYLSEIGDFEGSRRLSKDALDQWTRHGAADDEQALASLQRLAAALKDLGRYGEAYRLADEGWRRLVEHPAYGVHHPTTLKLSDLLAVLDRVFGRYADALRRDRQIVEAYQRIRGDSHTATLQARNNLAVSLRVVGDFRAAHDIDTELAGLRRIAVGPDHQRTLLSVSNLARDLYGLGDYAASLDLQQSIWPTYQSRLVRRHPHLLAATRTIVQGLRKTGRLAEALDKGRQLYLHCQESLGTEHELTLAAKVTYANALCANGEVYKASSFVSEAVDRYRRTFGDRNPLTLAAATNQAIILRALGERRQARQIGEVSCQALRDVVGPDHPYTIAATVGVANDLVLAREEDIARRRLAGALEDAKRILGEQHPDTLICATNLGILMSRDSPESRGLLDKSIDQLRRALGTGHPVVTAAVAGKPTECDIEPPPV
ncbi:FxSxx-COOH system tetratricopeptide repeat protein [Krasilnikovia sp. M28-CT-15]|uniref:FxSxx-COOH system tetratricopeptide repeat protein n=1 Tax=Krasilnikovia sp. M28-CT-15 TaxID=3373540 RepID=UPI0038772596